jgi:hypothetical protein
MRQNNKPKVKKPPTKPNVLKTLWKKFKSSINLGKGKVTPLQAPCGPEVG